MINHILVSRVDAIGDVVLTLPLLKVIKQDYPKIKISFLGRSYTKDILENCESVDQFINFDDWSGKPDEEVVYSLKKQSFDQVLHVFPQKQVARLCFKAKIPVRTGTLSRPFHWLNCNNLVKLSRKNSELHEAQLNIELWRMSQKKNTPLPTLPEIQNSFGIVVNEYWPEFLQKTEKKKIIIHPGSRGSARNWPIKNYVSLTEELLADGHFVFLTGTQAESDEFEPYFSHIQDDQFYSLTGRLSLLQLMGFIKSCDALVACSTGPLHIAAALGKSAVGLFVPLRPVHPGRWAPLGERAKVLCTPTACKACKLKEENRCPCIEKITPNSVSNLFKGAQSSKN